jgi:hypothetical protein
MTGAGAFQKSTKRVPRTTGEDRIRPIAIGRIHFSTNPTSPGWVGNAVENRHDRPVAHRIGVVAAHDYRRNLSGRSADNVDAFDTHSFCCPRRLRSGPGLIYLLLIVSKLGQGSIR